MDLWLLGKVYIEINLLSDDKKTFVFGNIYMTMLMIRSDK